MDPSPYQDSWAIEALCEHLQAVTDGHVRRLVVNLPPRCGKSRIASIAFPAWTWARDKRSFTSGPQVQFMALSYNHELSLSLSNETRRLITSSWYQARWGSRFGLMADQNTKGRFDNTEGGSRIATSVGGSMLGIGYSVGIVDDPHNTEEVESDADRETALNSYGEFSSTRMNDPKQSAIVVIMQRLHENDVTGHIMRGQDSREWTHLMIPMRYEKARHCVTVLRRDGTGKPAAAWQDPRKRQGDLMWPERFGDREVALLERELGPYRASGRLQQSPQPASGGIIKREWWQPWPAKKYPLCEVTIASLDTAYTEKQENDPSALTIWGLFRDANGAPKVMLLWAWEGRLEIHDLVNGVATVCSNQHRPKEDLEAVARVLDIPAVPRFRIDRLLIEGKASGHSVAQEIKRLYGNVLNAGIEVVDPTSWGDKTARLYAVQHLFADGSVYAPDRPWAHKVIDQVARAPKSDHDDLTDTVSMCLRYMRLTGILARTDEWTRDEIEKITHKPVQKALYPSMAGTI